MYTVTRQRQWPDGTELVEVSAGGLDYTNPDALAEQYSGEFTEYKDPREAVESAIAIARAWRKDTGKRKPVGIGATGGMTMPFEPGTFAAARSWAKQEWDRLPKCAGCNEPMPDSKRDTWHANDWDGLEYCSEHCATRAAEWEAQENYKARVEELEAEGLCTSDAQAAADAELQ